MKHSPRSWSKARQNSSRSLRLVLEPRMVFDGSVADVIDAQAAADPAPDASSDASLPIEAQAAESRPLAETSPAFSLADAQAEALRLISEFLQQPDAQNQLFTLFGGQQDVASQEWLDTAQSLSQDIVEGRYTVRVEAIGNAQIGGIFAAYSGQGPSGEATIFINQDWLDRSPSRETVSRVLIEELGHSLDHALNGSRDTAGDEGEAFAASVLHSDLNDADRARIAVEDDHSTVYLDGQTYEVEDAALTFSAVYKGTPSSWSQEAQRIQNVATVTGSNFKFTSLDPNAPYFSGNNVSGTLTYTDNLGVAQSIDGVVSRLFKTGSTVEGLFFYAWGNTTTIGDGATDAAETSYILCIDPSKFTDGHSYYSTSSDPVDTKMNALIVPNSAPVANNDIATVSEDSSITGNVLTNDTDVNLDSLAVSAFTIAGSAGPFVTGTPYSISGVGSLTLNSSGSFTFTPAANYAGPVPLITYTVSDGSATSTATLSISITPVNDAPTGTDDSVTTTKDTPVILGISDFGSYSDIENSPLAKIQITTLESKGRLEYFNGSSWVDVPLNQEITAADINAGKLRYTPASGESGASYTTIGFKVSDGSAYSAGAYTLTVNVNAGNATPVANADTAPDAVEAGYNITGTNPAGNVLSNDSDADTAITAGTTHKVTLAGNASANTSGAVADGATSSSSPASIGGLYGTLKIGADGSYIYEVDNSNLTVQALRTTSNKLTETFTYTMADASGATASSTLTVVIKGSNDAPVAVNDYDALQETALSGGNYGSTSGNVLPNDTDVDAGDSKTVSGSYAGATGSSVGTTSITLTGSGLNSISAGDYVYWDNNGAKTLLTVNNGTAVKVATSSNGTITLDNQTALSSNDQGHVFINSDIIGFNGSYPISGNYKTATYSSTSAPSATSIGVSNITQAISIGMSVTNGTDTRTVTGVTYDGSGNITQITVNTAVAWSAANLTFSAPASTTLTGRYGTLTLNSTGSYTYNLTSNVLNNGQSFTEQFSYRLSDTGGATDDAILYITVSGTTTTTLADDSVTVSEDSGAYISGASNLLSNDTNATSITGFSWNGQTAAAGNSITVSGIGVLTVNSDGTFSFNPEDNYTGTVPSVTYTATDGTYAASATLSISITPANDAPTASNDTVTTLEDTTVILALSDFGAYSDIENTALATIKITTLETSGSLEYNNGASWIPVTQDQEISVADISAGKLRFVPAADANGSPYTTVGFKVSDGTDYSASAYTLTLNVTPVNDAPINTVPGAQTLSDYQTLTFTSGLSVADIDDVSLTVNLSVANGTLSTTLDNQNGTGVQSGSGTTSSPLVLTGTKAEINAMLASLVYTPDGGFSGADTLRMVTTDAGGLSDTDYVAITVNADNRALTVSSPTVSEASPYAVFSVGGATGQKVFLALDVTGTGTGYAVSGSDFLPSLEYFNGTSWTAYTGSPVAIPAGGTVLLVRTPILQDTVNEGSETFKLTATNTAGVANAAGGIATIRDDGQGDIYPDNTTGATDNGATKDDDRPLAVNNIIVNEASPYAVFEVTGVAGQKVASLALVDGTAQGGSDYGTSFEYFNSGTNTWTAYSPSITLDGTGKLLVRTTINNDTATPVYEGAETFGLVASNVGGRSFSGTAVILDDGTGDIYPDNTTGTKDLSPTGLDYDSAVSVTAFGPVNEGSTFAMFTVTGTAGVPLELSLNNRSTALEFDSAQNNYAKIEYSDDGSNWTTYTWDGTTGNKPTAPGSSGNGTFYVRVTIASETDTIHEGAETFDLIATTIATGTTLTQSAYATSTIIDNGTGSKYDGTITSGTPTSNNSSLDNDTPTLTVSSPTVSEGDGYAVFTVSIDHASTTNISFTPSLSNVTATLATDTAAANTLEVSTNGGTSWSTVSGAVTIAAGQTSVQLRLAITDDTAIESSETFTLSTGTVTGALTSSTAVIGTATITDNDSPSNHTPVAQNDTGSTAEDTTLTVSAANGLITSTLVSGGVDSDADVGDSLSITQFTVAGDATIYTAGQTATIAGKGSLTINSNGSYEFTPAANYNGSVPVATYTLSDGTATTTATLTLTVTAVNDVPLAQANSYTATEDTLLTGKNIITDTDGTAGTDSDIETATASLTIAKVNGTAWAGLTGGTDADHLAANGWKQVSLTNGTLFIKQDGSTEYKPALNSTTGDSFTYTVSDGTDESASATVSFNVTAVNDAPTSSDDSVTTAEDTAKLLAISDFGSYSDTENTAIASVKITTLESDGSLEYHNGTDWVAVTLNQEISAADITANKLRFVPDANENGSPYATIGFKVSDGTDYSAGAYTLTVNVTAVNDAPTSSDDSVTTAEDTAKLLAISDFGSYSDTENTAIASVKITTLESDGSLEYHNGTDWVAVTLNQEISAADIAANKLRFVPDANENGSPYATIGFKVSDGTDYSAGAYTLTVNVTAVNDAPTSSDDSVTTAEDTAKLLAISDFGSYSDTENTAIASVKITTLESDGSLEYHNGTDWVAVTLNQEISAADIAANKLRFVPDANENGSSYATIGFKVSDGTDYSAGAYTLTVNVTTVNDAPTSSDDSVTTAEDTAKLLALTDFGSYSDTENTAIASVKITTLESDGSLEYHNGTDWVAVTLNQEISAADITANKLRFVPDANENGSPYATIGFKVSDGTDYSAGAYTLTVNVTAVNDVPLAKDNSYTATEDTLLTGKNIITDTDGTAGTDSDVETATASLTIAKVNGTAWAGLTGGTDAGHLSANGWKQVSLTNGTLSIKQDGSTEYKPALNSTTGDSFTYTVSDGTDESASTATVTLNVTAVSDAAVIGGVDTGSVTEDMNAVHGMLSNTGRLTISDPDTGEAMFRTGGITAGAGALGSLSITSDGVWTYTVANADVQYLNAGQTKTETFTVKSADGTSHEVVITIIGINDAAVIGGGDTGAVTEDLNVTSGNLSSTGTLSISDSDTGEAVFQASRVTAGAGTLGSLSITSAGAWIYTVPNDAVQYLTTGETKTETFTVMAGDGALHEVVITINGVSDAPSGSIVQLANLPPLLTPTDTTQVNNETASAYASTDNSDSNYSGFISAANGGTISDSSAKMFGSQSDPLHYELTLTGTIKNQLILENKEFSFRIPAGVFRHTNSSEVLDFKATSPSGGPLPSWVHFDPNAKTFSGVPPVGAKAVTVLVIVRDTNGREVRTSFTIGVNKEDVTQGISTEKTVNQPNKEQPLAGMTKRFNSIPGKPGLTEQVHAAGKLSRLQESRALLDSLKQL